MANPKGEPDLNEVEPILADKVIYGTHTNGVSNTYGCKLSTDKQSSIDAIYDEARVKLIGKIHALQDAIAAEKAKEPSNEQFAKITMNYCSIARLVQNNYVELDALLDCIEYFYEHRVLVRAEEMCRWLDNAYRVDGYPNPDVLKRHYCLMSRIYSKLADNCDRAANRSD